MDDDAFLVEIRRMKKPPPRPWRAIYSSPTDNGVRDPEFPCDAFEHGKPGSIPARPLCPGDGHYLCDECRRAHPGTIE
jgi:hypothetical protein